MFHLADSSFATKIDELTCITLIMISNFPFSDVHRKTLCLYPFVFRAKAAF